MQERAEHTNKAAAAKAERAYVRSRSRRRVTLVSLALFAVVLTLLSYRLAAGLDPSTQNTVASTSTTTTATPTASATEEESESDDSESADSSENTDSESDSGSSVDSATSSGSTTSPAPVTRAS